MAALSARMALSRGLLHRVPTNLARSAVRSMAPVRAMSVKVDERHIGDYPDFKVVNAQTKAPWGFWDKQDRRNFNETLHEDDEIHSVWSPDVVYANNRVKDSNALLQLLMLLAVLAGVYQLAKAINSPEKRPVENREKLIPAQLQ